MGDLNLFGKTFNTVGNSNSNFIIKTKGDLKIQWGNKFIDLIKGGKIVSDTSNIFKETDSEESIVTSGLYKVGEDLYICINGAKFKIKNAQNNNYVEFSSELKDITNEFKIQALKNIGLFYDTYDELLKLENYKGVVYALDKQNFYLINNGEAQVCPNLNNPEFQDYMTPPGSIIMFYPKEGKLSSIPKGWALCDGTNGTPDLRKASIWNNLETADSKEARANTLNVEGISKSTSLKPHTVFIMKLYPTIKNN